MSVDTQHPEYIKAAKKKWPTMRDVIAGEDEVKEKGITYLPPPGETDPDTKKYASFKLRARFVRYTGRTTSGLNGTIYRKAPVVELPSTLEYMKDNADGAGQNLEQISKETTQGQNDIGRVGILLDRPPVVEGATLEDDIKNNLRSNLSIYKAESIINWKTKKIGGATILVKVVLAEEVEIEKEFETETEKQYRVLILDETGYHQQLYDAEKNASGEPIYPKNENDQVWDKIPFKFVGSKDNTESVDEPPFYGLAGVNLGHYINSADYEWGVHMFGQPTPWCDPGEMNYEQWKTANPNGIVVGSSDGVLVGKGGKFDLVYMQANSAAKEAMDQKEKQMVSIGAKIVQDAGQAETAEAARINASAENSLLNTIVGNAEDAIESLLKMATEFEGGNPEEVSFKINREFFPFSMSPQDITAFFMGVDISAVAKSDVQNLYRRMNWVEADRTNEEINQDIADSGGGLGGGLGG